MARIERAKNAGRGVAFGSVLKIYQILVPFALRTVMIYYLGIEYVGLNSLFSSVLYMLNIAELGVGAAMVFCMYEPIAADDHKTVCALMRLYKLYYRRIGLVIAVIGGILTPFIPYLIKSDVPADLNIYVLYLLNLGATVLSYWLFAYKQSILQAHQRIDVISKATLLANTVQYGLQFAALIVFRSYYAYVIISLLGQLFTNVAVAIASGRLYPAFKAYGELPEETVRSINGRIKDLFTAKISGAIINSADSIVISVFMGLTTLAVYQNYYYIMYSICGFIGVIFGSVTAGIGNSLITEGREKNYTDFKKFTFIICFILNVCCCCFTALYQPFMKIWVGEDLMLGNEFVVLFCVLFYLLELAMVWATVKDAAGLWHADRFRLLISSMANLMMNLVLVQFIGLYGIMLSTILSYALISMPWLIHNLFKLLYKQNLKRYLLEVFIYSMTTLATCLLVAFICGALPPIGPGFVEIAVKGMIAVVIGTGCQVLVFHHTNEYRQSVYLIKNIVNHGG